MIILYLAIIVLILMLLSYNLIRGKVPEKDFTVPIGEAVVRRQGQQISLISYGLSVHHCLAAAAKVQENGIDCEVVDLRTIKPLDVETVLADPRVATRLQTGPGVPSPAEPTPEPAAPDAVSATPGPDVRFSGESLRAAFPSIEERLVSRFKWGLETDMTQPCFETRAAIVRRKARMRMGFPVACQRPSETTP